MALPESSAEAVETAVDLNEMLGASPRGVFTVQLEPFRDWENTKVLVWTDIGALAHWQQDALAIYVHNLYSLEPIAGADVTVYSEKNQIMARATTNAEGVARVNNLDSKLGPPRAAVIESASDYAFLKLEHEYTEGLPHAGFAGYDREGYDVYMYADRNLYRPGEPVHLQWIARTNYGDALADRPLQLLVYNPNGQEIQKQAVTLTNLGTAGIDLNTEETSATGR